MLRKLSLLLVTCFSLLTVTVLVGCGDNGSSSSASNPETDPEIDYPAPELMAEFHPDWDEKGVFANAASCGDCHSAATDSSGVLRFPKQADGEDISPYAGWRHTVMAHAFDDPYFQAVVQDEVKQFPNIAGTIEDKCLTCHSPMAHNHAHYTGVALNTDACLSVDGCYRMDEAEEDMTAREGISCTLCHQIDTSSPDSKFSGGFVVNSDGPKALTIYGPYDDPITNAMRNNTQYEVEGLAAIQKSEQCAVCHNLKTPSVNVDTNEFTGNEFVEQSVYTEWLNSVFNDGVDDKECQDCHMPRLDNYESQIARTASGSANTNWPLRDEYSQHGFLGANTYLLTLLKNFREVLGISDTTTVAGFENQIENNTQFLTEQTASVDISNIELVSNTLQIDVDITNHSGHKLPTGYPSRRVWLNLLIKNAAGDILFESGTPDEDGFLTVDADQADDKCTEVVKTDNYVESECFMTHKNIITTSDEVAIYEAVMADTNNQVAYVLLHGDRYLKDNRIPPEGFTLTSPNFSSDIAIVGDALTDADFNQGTSGEGSGTDTLHYQLDWSANPSETVSVEVILYYQSIKPAFVTGLHHDGDKIDRFKWMYNQHKPLPVSLANDQMDFLVP